MSTSRVAVCIYGNMRLWEYTKINILPFFGDDVDYFLYTTDMADTEYTGIAIDKVVTKQSPVTESDLKNDFEGYNLRSLKIDPYEDYFKKISFFRGPNQPGVTSFEIMKEVIQMKKQYEFDNNFTYDIMALIRPDVVFFTKQPINLTNVKNDRNFIYASNEMAHEISEDITGFCDGCIIGTNAMINHMQGLYDFSLHFDRTQSYFFNNESAFYNYLMDYNIIPMAYDRAREVNLQGHFIYETLRPTHNKPLEFFKNMTNEKIYEIKRIKREYKYTHLNL